MKRFLPALLIPFYFIVLPNLARADAPTTIPTEQLESVHWQFSTFLKGTTGQVRELINGQLEQQLARKASLRKQIDEANDAINTKLDQMATKTAASDPAFAAVRADAEKQKGLLDTARKEADSTATIKAQNALTDDNSKIHDALASQAAADPDITARKKQISDAKASLVNVESGVSKASKARDQILDGLRMSIKLPGPPATGRKGILGRVKPTKIVDANSFVTDYDAVEVTGDDPSAKSPDGFKAVKGKLHKCKLLVTGVDTSQMKVGTEIILDQFFVITGTQEVAKSTVYVVAPAASEPKEQAINYLFSRLDELKQP
jgi:hypothetical protein